MEQQPMEQQHQPGQELFGEAQQEEEEYKPQEVVVDQNPYAAAQQEEQMPMGFGAERANLMGEQAM